MCCETRRRVLVPALVVVTLSATSASCERQPNAVVHPTADNLPAEGSAAIRSEGMPLGLDSAALEAWVTMRNALLSDAKVQVALGQEGSTGGAAPDLFGIELDVVVDGDRIAILDRQNYAVKVFDRAGQLLESFGRAGNGPGEFRAPAAMELPGEGRLAVLDRGRELKLFSQTDSGYAYADSRDVAVVPEYMCTTEGRVFVSGWRSEDNTMIHEVPLAPDGPAASFGRGYQSDEWLIQDQMSDGPIACLGGPVRVFLAFERLPLVRAYGDGGALLWTSHNEDYLQPPVTEVRDAAGRAGVRFSNRGVRDMVVSLEATPSGHLVLQSIRGAPSPDPGEVEFEIRSYLIDAETGQGAFISNSLPMLAAVGRGFYVARWMLPFPRIELRNMDSSER